MDIFAVQPPKPLNPLNIGRMQVKYASGGIGSRDYELTSPGPVPTIHTTSYQDALKGAQTLSRANNGAYAIVAGEAGMWDVMPISVGEEALRVLSAQQQADGVADWRFVEISKSLRAIVTPNTVIDAAMRR
jgi:hypothetical protein